MPSQSQVKEIERILAVCRQVWNYARVHETISNTRKDYHFKLAHHLCDQAGMIFVQDINFKAWAKGMLSKHTLDAGFGKFFNILAWVCWKRGVYFAKVNPDYTSQTCPNCGVHTGKKDFQILLILELLSRSKKIFVFY